MSTSQRILVLMTQQATVSCRHMLVHCMKQQNDAANMLCSLSQVCRCHDMQQPYVGSCFFMLALLAQAVY